MNGSVYAVERPDGMVKIGVSKHPRRRMRTIETQGGFKAKAKFFADAVENGREIEKRVHEHFAPFRNVGEYFSVDFRVAVHVIDEITKEYGVTKPIDEQEWLEKLRKGIEQTTNDYLERCKQKYFSADAMEDIREDDEAAYKWLIKNGITATYSADNRHIMFSFRDENGEQIEMTSQLFFSIANLTAKEAI